VTALDRLVAAGQRLLGDLSTGVMSQLEMFLDFGDVDGDGDTDLADALLVLMDNATKAFTVGMVTDSIQADTGIKGEVAVPVPVSTTELVLAACMAASVIPGQIPSQPATRVTCPPHVPIGAGAIRVAIDPGGAPGLYFGHVRDQGGDLQRPFLIFLDGLT
jgi:hypothetical protein